jgi:hypothetical protein
MDKAKNILKQKRNSRDTVTVVGKPLAEQNVSKTAEDGG